MARIRTVKPELPADKKMAALPIEARYTFVLLITQADDEGFVRGEKRQLLGALYPHDEAVTQEQLEAWLAALVDIGAIVFRQTVDGARVVQLTNWHRHQRIANPSTSKLRESLVNVSAIPHEPFTKDSVLEVGSRSRKKEGEEEKERDMGGEPVGFAECWQEYPRRAGGNSRKDAAKAFAARVRDGATVAELLDGTKRYAAFVRATRREGTEYVKQGATFYGPSDHFREPWTLPVEEESPRERSLREAYAAGGAA